MCGLAGIFEHDGAPVDSAALMRMREAMLLRGPDSAGMWLDPDGGVGLAHRRLAIIDLTERGAQPMASPDGRLHVVLNGEIYNYPELRAWCEARGARFASNSDTEVLLHLYELIGHDFVRRLRGMYAFALWDSQQREVLLARDPFGIKPLYYADDGRRLQFASQVKAMLAGGLVDSRQDPAGVVSFFLWGYVTEPHTLYRAVRALPAGTALRMRAGGRPVIERYHAPLDALRTAPSVIAPGGALHDALLDSVRHHLLSDVPVGVFLSAGIDSGALLGLVTECGDTAALRAFTLGFREFEGTANDEAPLARTCAAYYDCKHDVQFVGHEAAASSLKPFTDAMDQPTVDGLNTYLVSAAAAQSGLKVALSGLGGDELFGGYPSFGQVPRVSRWVRWAPLHPSRALRWALSGALPSGVSPKYAGLFEYGRTLEGAYLLRRALYMPWELERLLEPEVVAAGLRELAVFDRLREVTAGIADPYLQVMALEYDVYMKNCLLRDADWAGMAHSLEIRVPLVDAELFAAVGGRLKPGGHHPRKRDLATAPSRPLPPEIVDRTKTGFSVPVQQWLAAETGTQNERGLRGWAQWVASRFEIAGLRSNPSPLRFKRVSTRTRLGA
jgi:asparagine synthase (glutamine-hydrolysing)